jgi:hypothetical protein
VIDTDSMLLDPQYEALGLDAVLAVSPTLSAELVVLDMTAGVDITMAGGVDAPVIRPAAMVRLAEIEDRAITTSQLTGATLTFADKAWGIVNWKRKPIAGGRGELMLILEDGDV